MGEAEGKEIAGGTNSEGREMPRPSKAELEQRWWHRLFKVLRAGVVVAVLLASILISVAEMNAASRTAVPEVTLTKWAHGRIAAVPQGRMIGVAEFLKEKPGGSYIGCQSQIGITPVAIRWLEDSAATCGLVDKSPEEQASFLAKLFPEYEVHNRDGVLCIVQRQACADGGIVWYSYQSIYAARHYAGVVLIPLAVTLTTVLLLNLLYYRMILYVVFGKDVPPASV